MRNRKEILEYLVLPENWCEKNDIEELITTAQQIEEEYEQELADGSVGYGLSCDLSSPCLLEDCEIEKIAIVNGIVIYKKLEVK
jgi:hypothetical protein